MSTYFILDGLNCVFFDFAIIFSPLRALVSTVLDCLVVKLDYIKCVDGALDFLIFVDKSSPINDKFQFGPKRQTN